MSARETKKEVQISPDGKEVRITGDFDKILLNGTVIADSAFSKTAIADFQIGEVMGDKTVYAGELAKKKIYAAPHDAKLAMTFNEAADYAQKLNKENYLGHNDWRVPTIDELDVLNSNQDKGGLKGTFDAAGGRYWSSMRGNSVCAFNQWFKGGQQGVDNLSVRASVRCVR